MPRVAVAAVVLLAACGSPQPLAVYRFPLPAGPDKVSLRTLLAEIDATDELVLFSGTDGAELARGGARTDWLGEAVTPYGLSGPGGLKLRVNLRDHVLQDAMERPWSVVPQAPLVEDDSRVTRVRLASDALERTLVVAGSEIYAEQAEAQPAPGSTPSALEVLGSTAGIGLNLPPQVGAGWTWKDSFSTAVPPDPARPVACGAPFVAALRSVPERVRTPIGEHDAVRVTEVVDVCPGTDPATLKVFRVDRWFVAGIGPVRMFLNTSDGGAREYRLLSHGVEPGSGALWPLGEGDSWSFEVRGSDGKPIGAPQQVRVTGVERVAPASER